MRRFQGVCFVAVILALLILAAPFPAFPQQSVQVGFAVLESDGPLAGAALFSFRDAEGVLVWEAGVPASRPALSGRLFVQQSEATRTAVALANATNQPSHARFFLRDREGVLAGETEARLGAGEQRAFYVDELFENLPSAFLGSLEFRSQGGPLAAVTLRENLNRRGRPIYATLPVFSEVPPQDEAGETVGEGQILPQVGAGDGLSTLIVLMNPTQAPVAATLALTLSDGSPWPDSDAIGPVVLPPLGTREILVSAVGPSRSGYAVVEPAEGHPPPLAAAIFQFRDGDGYAVTEAGVSASPLSGRIRTPVDHHLTRTGLAIASPGNPAQAIRFRLLDRFGQFLTESSQDLAANGHVAVFADEVFPELPDSFSGLLELRADFPVSAATLKLTVNRRGEPVLTTLPLAVVGDQVSATLVFPQIGFGEGLATRMLLLNPSPLQAASGTLRFRSSGGGDFSLRVGDRFGSQVSLSLRAGALTTLRPGSRANAARILLDAYRPGMDEITIRRGSRFIPRFQVVDTEGNPRDDFTIHISGLDSVIVKSDGTEVEGLQPGLSTFRAEASGVTAEGVFLVVEVTGGFRAGPTPGIVQDSSGAVYWTRPEEHVVLRSDSLSAPPSVYAGRPGEAGLRDGDRSGALFNHPSWLALDPSTGNLYVSDRFNHAIRRIAADGRVETLAGGAAGSGDGPLETALFREPAGLALDLRGRLWVADSGNHVIRLIDLPSGSVSTVAGTAGRRGFNDAQGAAARFDGPSGIAVEQSRPPASVWVADTGNGAVRRISEDGTVTTYRAAATEPASLGSQGSNLPSRLPAKPVGIAVDRRRVVHVSDPGANLVFSLRPSGRFGLLTPEQSAFGVIGLSLSTSGGVIAAGEALLTGRGGRPFIQSVEPNELSLAGGETVIVRGRNFSGNESVVIVGDRVISDYTPKRGAETRELSFTSPGFELSGPHTVSIFNNNGNGQFTVQVASAPLEQLPPRAITTVAGSSQVGELAEAVSEDVPRPRSLALGLGGLIFIDGKTVGTLVSSNPRIRKLNLNVGIPEITTVAGSGIPGFSGDGGLAGAARFTFPQAVAVDGRGNVFVSDSGGSALDSGTSIRRIDFESGVIDLFAGNGRRGFAGDGGDARKAEFDNPLGMAADAAGNLFIADRENDRIRRVDAQTGVVTTFAGGGRPVDRLGDGSPAAEARLEEPHALAFDQQGNLYIADTDNQRIRRVDAATGLISTVAGDGVRGFSGDGGPAAAARLHQPVGVAVDPLGNVYVADRTNRRVRRIDAADATISTVLQPGDLPPGQPGPASIDPVSVAVDGAGVLYVADFLGNRILRRRGGQWSVIAGTGEEAALGDGAKATAASIDLPHGSINVASGIAVDGQGNLMIADTFNNRVRRVDRLTGYITTVAGSGGRGASGDGGTALEAALDWPRDVALDEQENLYIAVTSQVRKVDAAGAITTVAQGLSTPVALAVDRDGDLLIADEGRSQVYLLDAATGDLSVFAGVGGFDFSGDGGPAADAALAGPGGVAVDAFGNVWISDTYNHRIRRVDAITGRIETVAGTGEFGDSGDGGPARLARLGTPRGLAFDAGGNLYVADTFDIVIGGGDARLNEIPRIRRITPSGVISTVAGAGVRGYAGDGGPAAEAVFDFPDDVAVGPDGTVYVADSGNDRIRAFRRE